MSRGFLLDTCVFAEYSKPFPDSTVIDWLETNDASALFMSVVTIGEIEKGIARMSPSKRRDGIRSVLDALIVRFGSKILPVTKEVARRWGSVTGNLENQGITIPVMDGLIAATALEYELVVVTRNVSDFESTGAELMNPWPDT